jgi:ribose transport system ATP-binding protein
VEQSLPALRVHCVSKRFGATQALDSVSMDATAGNVVALLGQNGAGKSTLIKILAGALAPDSGEIFVNGDRLAPEVSAAQRAGIAVIYQDLALFPNLTVAENVAGDLARAPFYSARRVQQRARQVIAQLGVALPPDTLVGELPIAGQQLAAIARAIARESRILVLDEPTASLGEAEAERLLSLVRELARAGHTAIFVSHRMAEVRRIADHFVVLRDGAVAYSGKSGETSDNQLLQAMFGSTSTLGKHATTPAVEKRPGTVQRRDARNKAAEPRPKAIFSATR